MNDQPVRELIAEHLGLEVEKVDPQSSIETDLGGDSLDLIEIVMDLEEKFAVEITDEEGNALKTVQDCIDLIDKLKA